MNVNDLLRRIKSKLGLGMYLKTRRNDTQLIDEIILGISLPTFSYYYKNSLLFNNVFLKKQDGMGNIYEIVLADNIKQAMVQHGITLKSIHNIDYNMYQGGMAAPNSIYGTRGLYYTRRGGCNIDDMITAYEAHSSMQYLDAGMSCELVEPHSIRFFDTTVDYSTYPLNLEVHTSHSNNLSTIKDKLAKAFEDLATLDIMIVLYNSEFKFITGTETQYSRVDTKTDDWANAEDKRTELLKEFAEDRLNGAPLIIAY